MVHEDQAILFGGFDTGIKTNQIHKYEFQNGRWKLPDVAGVLPCARSGHSATIYKHSMVIFGGSDSENTRLNDVWLFDLHLNMWSHLLLSKRNQHEPRPRAGHSACLIHDDFLVIFGGCFAVTKELDDVSVLNLKEKIWTQLTEPK